MSVRTYNPQSVILTVGGVPLSGFADGTFVRVERKNDSFSMVSGADGVVSRSKMNDYSGTVTITLAQTSPSNAMLSAFAAADELTNKGIFPISCMDASSSVISGEYSLHFSAYGWVKKPASVEYGKDVSNREWTLDCADLMMFAAGNADFVIPTPV
jgi:hypothetical protein